MSFDIIRLFPCDERNADALELARSVFTETQAEKYGKVGTENFIGFTKSEKLLNKIADGTAVTYICEDSGVICGMMVIMDRKHISLAFVDNAHRHTGAGTALFNAIINDFSPDVLTVNASPYGLRFYRHLGFKETDMERVEDGIIYTPMKYVK